MAGRTTKTIENYVDGTVSNADDKTTEYTYSAAGMTKLTADVVGGGGQTTEWVYGVTQSGGSGIDSNDIVGATKWPDPTTGASSSGQQETVTVDALGETKTSQDRNGSIHTLSYDVLGRVTSDAVTTLGTGVDGAVRRVETAYDTQGNAYLSTTYDAASGGSIVTQVQRAYNGLGQLITEYQAHGGAVNTSTSPKVQYGYSTLDTNNRSRLTSITYPNGRVIGYNYTSGIDSDTSRLSSITDSGVTVEAYSYLGQSTVVVRSHPQTGIDLTYLKRSGESNTDAGDQYIGLDRFGRVIDQRWVNASTGTATDRMSYTYDRDGNRLTKGNSVNTAFNEVYTYDGLNQLSSSNRGSGTRTQSWDYDALGNWDSITTNGTAQTRTANKQNEITSVSGATTPTYDSNGNMTGDENGKTLVYDAWNRLVAYKNGGTVLVSYKYDGLGRMVVENSGTARDLYYSKDWQVLEEQVSGVTKDSYVWSPVYVDAMIVRDRPDVSDRQYVQQDANYNVTAILNTSGTVLERYAEDAFGKATFLDASWSTLGSSVYAWNYIHQGGRLDSTTGLVDFRHRPLSTFFGRWVSMDPIGYNSGDVDLYRIENNNPLASLDWNGLQTSLQHPKNAPIIAETIGPGVAIGTGTVIAVSPIIPAIIKPVITKSPKPQPNTEPSVKPDLQRSPEPANKNDEEKKEKNSCFAAGTPMRTLEGWRCIEDIRVGDEVLSRSEFQANGIVESKTVEEVFVTQGRVWNLTVASRVIKTSELHPFYVSNRGWVSCKDLKAGDFLVTQDGITVAVEKVEDSGNYETLYNFRVADFHTYFVGDDEWGFSVWAHNVCLIHYTNALGYAGIMLSKKINPSIGKTHARYGDGQYFTNILPIEIAGRTIDDLTKEDLAEEKISLGQLSWKLYNVPYNISKVEYYIIVDLKDKRIENPATYVYLVAGDLPMDITGKIVASGKVLKK